MAKRFSTRVDSLRGILDMAAEDPRVIKDFCVMIDEDFPPLAGFVPGEVRAAVNEDFVLMSSMVRPDNYDRWSEVIARFNIKANRRILKEMSIRGEKWLKDGINLFENYLDCIKIDKDKFYHKFLMGRALNENLTYGTLNIVEQFALFSWMLDSDKAIELRYISAIVVHMGDKMFRYKRANHSQLVNLNGYYNLPNIVESLLVIAEIRAGLHTPRVCLNNVTFDLDEILSEIALHGCVSAKVFVKEIRSYLQYVVRHSTAGSDVHVTYTHVGFDYNKPSVCPLVLKALPCSLVKAFYNAETYRLARVEGKKMLHQWKVYKLDKLCDALLGCNLLITNPNDFVVACGFVQCLMKIAGYGRAYRPSVATEEFPQESSDPLNFAKDVENTVEHLHELSIEAGCLPVSGDNWIAACTSLWRSTSSGMQVELIEVTLDDKKKLMIKSKNKLVVGSVKGETLFSRAKLEEIYGKENYCMIGIRDVPYKATRLIFVCKLDVLHAQVGVISHIVDYISTVGESEGFLSKAFDSGFFFTGRSSMSGVRILDNLVTIASSGDLTVLPQDIDLSSFDSHNVGWNFRVPLMKGLKKAFIADTELFGKDRLTRAELVNAAYGPGRIHDTWWDNTRTAYVAIPKLFVDELERVDLRYFTEYTPKASVVNIGLGGTRAAKAGETWLYLDHQILDRSVYDVILHKYEKSLRMVVFLDGSDFINLKSEASGELSTLLMNSVVNYCLQRAILRESKNTSLGRKLEAFKLSVVGDDSETILRILNTNITSEDVDDYLKFLEETAGMCGHLLSAMKCFLMVCSSEMVQTYARHGLYLPRNQIMMIGSEKARNIHDPINFSMNYKRLMCSHIARGYDSRTATLILAMTIKYLTTFSARETDLNFSKEKELVELNVTDRMCRGKLAFNKLVTYELIGAKKLKWLRKKGSISNKLYHFSFSLLVQILPFGECSIGLLPHMLYLTTTDSVLMYLLTILPDKESNLIAIVWDIMNRLQFDYKSDTDNVFIRS